MRKPVGVARSTRSTDTAGDVLHVLETGSDEGMHTLDQSLARLVRQRRIDGEHARRLVADPQMFDELVRR